MFVSALILGIIALQLVAQMYASSTVDIEPISSRYIFPTIILMYLLAVVAFRLLLKETSRSISKLGILGLVGLLAVQAVPLWTATIQLETTSMTFPNSMGGKLSTDQTMIRKYLASEITTYSEIHYLGYSMPRPNTFAVESEAYIFSDFTNRKRIDDATWTMSFLKSEDNRFLNRRLTLVSEVQTTSGLKTLLIVDRFNNPSFTEPTMGWTLVLRTNQFLLFRSTQK